jgi:hypothetical protein
LAVDPATGSETGGAQNAGVARWTHPGNAGVTARSRISFEGAQGGPATIPADAADRVYRYGQRKPVLEELPLTDRAPAIAGVSAGRGEP